MNFCGTYFTVFKNQKSFDGPSLLKNVQFSFSQLNLEKSGQL